MTSTHAVDREEVMAWLDGELPPVRAGEVATHVESCADCRLLADGFRQVSTGLAAWRVDPPPSQLTPSPVHLGARSPGSDAVRGWSWIAGRTRLGAPRWVFAAAPALVLLFIATLWPGLERGVTNPTSRAPAATASPTASLGNRGASAGRGGVAGMSPGPSPGQQGRGQGRGAAALAPVAEGIDGPMIARAAAVALVTDHFDDMRPALERLTAAVKGSIGELQILGDTPNQRSMHGSLRVPADRLDQVLSDIRRLGKVSQESQSSEDIGDAHRDLVVRVANAKAEETRLNDLLARTGRLSDVLDVEREVTRVRGEIERMQAEELSMRNRVQLSTVSIEIRESYRAEIALGPVPLTTRLRNALVDGCRDAALSVVETLLILMRSGPTLIVWALVLGLPVRIIWRRSHQRVRD